MAKYFSEREYGLKARIIEEIPLNVWAGLTALVSRLETNYAFGNSFPELCRDGAGPCGCDMGLFMCTLVADIPGMEWPLNPTVLPSTPAILDLIEFCYEHVSEPIKGDFHSYWRHYHLTFDVTIGQNKFKDSINRIFRRNGIAYELSDDGQIIRLGPEVLREALTTATFNTGDTDLDNLLNAARNKFLSPDLNIRKESLEKLWDAWERLKTITPGVDKRTSISILLANSCSDPQFQVRLNNEALALTNIGNDFMIRHHETSKIPIVSGEQVDYLFHRLFALIYLILKTSNRI